MTYLFVGPTTCKLTTLGREYMGTLGVTQNGRTCQAWTARSPQVPFSSMQNSDFPEGSIAAALNYCRNPDNSPNGPWCYTTTPSVKWEYCNVAFCG